MAGQIDAIIHLGPGFHRMAWSSVSCGGTTRIHSQEEGSTTPSIQRRGEKGELRVKALTYNLSTIARLPAHQEQRAKALWLGNAYIFYKNWRARGH